MSILFVPGFMLDADLWRDVVADLSDFHPVAFADLSRDTSVYHMAHRALVDAPANFVLVGFSMGGYVAREIVRQAPDRVSALVLVATSARGDNDLQRQRKAAIVAQTAGAAFRGLSTPAIVSSLHPENIGRIDLIDRVKSMAQRLGGVVYRQQSLIVRHDERASLAEIKCPCLIIAGGEDKLRSRTEAEELHHGIGGSELQIIDKAGHMIPLEAPGSLAAAIVAWLHSLGND